MGYSLVLTGHMAQGRAHSDQALSLYDSATQRECSSPQFAIHTVTMLMFRALPMWLCGYPEAALASANQAVNNARQIGAAALMPALSWTAGTHIWCGDYKTGQGLLDELCALAKEKGSAQWNAWGILQKGWLFFLTGRSLDSISAITAALTEVHSAGATFGTPAFLGVLAAAHGELGKFDDAWRYIGEAITVTETSGERLYEAETLRTAGEIALLEPKPDVAKAEAYFNRALDIARKQHAKSWELRTAMSMARLWRNHGKRKEARELLSPVYDWFTEGFDTLELKEAKALLKELA